MYGVCLREENKLLKAKKESEGGKKRKIELMRSKKRKKKRNAKRVREKWLVLDVFQVTMARIRGQVPLKRKGMM